MTKARANRRTKPAAKAGTAGRPKRRASAAGSQRTFFLGIGGTLMGGLALLAREMGHRVSGSDGPLYPPMSDQLADAGITVHEGFDPAQMRPTPDLVVIGNAQLPRGHPAVEHMLDENLPYMSGAEWLGREVLRGRWAVATSGTHGKTTIASMVAHILECAGLKPGFLIGGVPLDFGVTSRLGESELFVVEADEYDTSYFDRRAKFVHYRPRTLVVSNIELDHADIYDDVEQIKEQFHQLVRTVPSKGLIVAPRHDRHVNEMLAAGAWTPISRFGETRGERWKRLPTDNGDMWQATAAPDGSSFSVQLGDAELGEVTWRLLGRHNVRNGIAALAAAQHVGVPPKDAIAALASFQGVKRRLEVVATSRRLVVYDDFAHHPTAIRSTLEGLRQHVGKERIVAVVEPRTHTMSLGTLRADLAACCAAADETIWFRPQGIQWDLGELARNSTPPATVVNDIELLTARIAGMADAREACHVVLMSNSAFGGIHATLQQQLGGKVA